MAIRSYHEQVDILNTQKLRELIKGLPPFTWDFFRGIEPTTTPRTRIAYAYDLQIFFQYLMAEHPDFGDKSMDTICASDLDKIRALDVEKFMEHLRYYRSGGQLDVERINQELGIKRKLSTLKSFYNYYFKKEMILSNAPSLVDLPKTREKEIIRLDIDEVARLLDQVESGEGLSPRQQQYHEKTRIRDLALMTLLLGTGIRVSECVGLNLQDIDYNNGGIHIRRKGGKEVILYFSEEVEEALRLYSDERSRIIPEAGHEDAFFLSMQRKRLQVRSVEKLVRKYSLTVTTLKHITPHKLRSTYGTSLYRETDDIYLVADVLGHSDVNTTRRHYAAMEDDRRRRARNKVQLREKN